MDSVRSNIEMTEFFLFMKPVPRKTANLGMSFTEFTLTKATRLLLTKVISIKEFRIQVTHCVCVITMRFLVSYLHLPIQEIHHVQQKAFYIRFLAWVTHHSLYLRIVFNKTKSQIFEASKFKH